MDRLRNPDADRLEPGTRTADCGKPLRLLIVEDSADDAARVVQALARGGYEISASRVDTADCLRRALEHEHWDLVISDYTLSRLAGTTALAILRHRDRETPFLFVSSTINKHFAVAAIRAGAQDYLAKGELARLLPAVERELRNVDVRRAEREAEAERASLPPSAHLDGTDISGFDQGGGSRSPVVRSVVRLVASLSTVSRYATGTLPTTNLALVAGVGVAYLVAGALAIGAGSAHPSLSPVWIPTGVALASVLLLGSRVWPGVFVGAALVNGMTLGSASVAIIMAVGNTLESLVGAQLATRFAGGRQAFTKPEDVLRFAGVAALGSTLLSATGGVMMMTPAMARGASEYGLVWLTWWLSGAVGVLLVTPLIVLWTTTPTRPLTRPRVFEFALLVALLLLTGQFVFAGFPQDATRWYPLAFLAVPFLLWAAFRFSPREAATATTVLAVVAIGGTLQGFGPFTVGTRSEALILLDIFLGVEAVSTLVVAAVVADRRRGELLLRRLAVSDPHTGLANYRQLLSVLDAELVRFERTARPFAVILLDVDHLKHINDHHGHLEGSRVLYRTAEALRRSCRTLDTAARFGGDEFVVVLPETGEAEAWRVTERVRDHVGLDHEWPRFTVSQGVAVCSRHGETAQSMIEAADRVMYDRKWKGRLGGGRRDESPAAHDPFRVSGRQTPRRT